VLQSGRAGPSAFDLSVRSSDVAHRRPPLFAGEDASEAAKSGSPGHHLGGSTGVVATLSNWRTRSCRKLGCWSG